MYFKVLSHRPLEFRAFFAGYSAICNKETGQLCQADKELIVMVTSLANRCSYSVVVHSAWYRVFSKNPVLSDQPAPSLGLSALPFWICLPQLFPSKTGCEMGLDPQATGYSLSLFHPKSGLLGVRGHANSSQRNELRIKTQ